MEYTFLGILVLILLIIYIYFSNKSNTNQILTYDEVINSFNKEQIIKKLKKSKTLLPTIIKGKKVLQIALYSKRENKIIENIDFLKFTNLDQQLEEKFLESNIAFLDKDLLNL